MFDVGCSRTFDFRLQTLDTWLQPPRLGQSGPLNGQHDSTIREGDSVISDPADHPKAFDWQAAFPEVFAQGGFDVVVGNPPYIRQELLSPLKPWLEAHYAVFHGMVDPSVYFYELGVRLLKASGLLCFVVTNKWMKAGYGEPLRRFFSERAWVRSLVDFGHARQIFEQVDVFPSIIFLEKPNEANYERLAPLRDSAADPI
jgi:hypothetical protein